MCCSSDFGLSEYDSSEEEGEEIHAYRSSRVVSAEEVAALIEAVTMKPNTQESCWAVLDEHCDISDASTDADEHEKQCQDE